jgi:pyridoxine 5'-phosphate synthase PdxJ
VQFARRSAPIAWSFTPSRSLAPSGAARIRPPFLWSFTRRRRLARSLGLGVNAGHDLDLENLILFRELPHLDEVSIGHAIVSRALFAGLEPVVREYLAILGAARGAHI